MGIPQALIGKKMHCTGCGQVVPQVPEHKNQEIYCSEACRGNYERLSTIPPPPDTVNV